MRWRVTFEDGRGTRMELTVGEPSVEMARASAWDLLGERFEGHIVGWRCLGAVGIPDAIPSTGEEGTQ